ncbi:MAG: nitroreductase family deazaflavin-dependent oxidoreductase [Dehalococcoidia bacterium]
MISDDVAALDYCYLTTTGRKSGLPREIEIWFGVDGGTVYLLAGGGEKAHWVQNIGANPGATLRLGDRVREALGRVVAASSEEDARARRLLLEKYQPRYAGDLTEWGRTALPVALDLEGD